VTVSRPNGSELSTDSERPPKIALPRGVLPQPQHPLEFVEPSLHDALYLPVALARMAECAAGVVYAVQLAVTLNLGHTAIPGHALSSALVGPHWSGGDR